MVRLAGEIEELAREQGRLGTAIERWSASMTEATRDVAERLDGALAARRAHGRAGAPHRRGAEARGDSRGRRLDGLSREDDTVPYFSWLNAGALLASAVVASALIVVALGAGPRRLINISFCLFAAAEAAWALAALLTDLQLWLGRGDPDFSLQNAMLFLTLMAPLLLLFTVRSLGRRNLAADVAAVAGLAATAALGVPLYRGDVVTTLGLGPSGTALVDVQPLGLIAAAVVAVLLVWSLVLLAARLADGAPAIHDPRRDRALRRNRRRHLRPAVPPAHRHEHRAASS